MFKLITITVITTILILTTNSYSDYSLQSDSPCIDAGEAIALENVQDLSNLKTFVTVNGVITLIDCPQWNWSLIAEECRRPAMNCIPVCDKYPNDKPDIGAMEWFPGQTNEKPWGDWNGIPLTDFPPGAPEAVQNLILSPKN